MNLFKATIRIATFAVVLLISTSAFSQSWVLTVDESANDKTFNDCISVDEGKSMLGIGYSWNNNPIRERKYKKGLLYKVDSDGNYLCQERQIEGMDLAYYCGAQLTNGNYMVFGACDDSLYFNEDNYERYLCMDLYDGNLNLIDEKLYRVDTDSCMGFHDVGMYSGRLSCVANGKGHVVLLAHLAYLKEQQYGTDIYNHFRVYDFDESGDTIRTAMQPMINGVWNNSSSTKRILFLPSSNSYRFFSRKASRCYSWDMDSLLNIKIGKRIGRILPNSEAESIVNVDSHLYENDQVMLSFQRHFGTGDEVLYYFSMYRVDSLVNVYATIDLPPLDSASYSPDITNMAYSNDSTIFFVSDSGADWLSLDYEQCNIALVDKDLNLLGRKVFKKDEYVSYPLPPVPIGDNGFFFVMRQYTGCNFPGQSSSVLTIRPIYRDDFEITLSVQNNESNSSSDAYPNPTTEKLNIPVRNTTTINEARIQIFDLKGVKYVDRSINKNGNLITIDTQNLEAGIYVYQVVMNDTILTKGKFIKENNNN